MRNYQHLQKDSTARNELVWATSPAVLREIVNPPELVTYRFVDIHTVKVLA
jgi:hypothetical protein